MMQPNLFTVGGSLNLFPDPVQEMHEMRTNGYRCLRRGAPCGMVAGEPGRSRSTRALTS